MSAYNGYVTSMMLYVFILSYSLDDGANYLLMILSLGIQLDTYFN